MASASSTRSLLCRFSSKSPQRLLPSHLRPARPCLHLAPPPLKALSPLQRSLRLLAPSRPFSLSTNSRQEAALSPPAQESQSIKADAPAYDLSFTCKKCETRSTHRVSKQGYHNGTVLITCPGCKNRHLIADHLKIFSDTRITIEDIMKEKGQLIQKGTLGVDGDVEFWDDGSETAGQPAVEAEKDGPKE